MQYDLRVDVELAIERIYIKNVNFSVGETPALFDLKWQPDLKVNFQIRQVNVTAKRIEVNILVDLDGTINDKKAVSLRLEQAGLFRLKTELTQDRRQDVGIACLNILFPYVREAIDNIIVKASLPPVSLGVFDFEKIVRQAIDSATTDAASAIRDSGSEILN